LPVSVEALRCGSGRLAVDERCQIQLLEEEEEEEE
jgi:hypothetical protein